MKEDNTAKLAKRSSSFGFYHQGGYTLVKATGGLFESDMDFFRSEVSYFEEQAPQHYIIDFGALDHVGENWVQMVHHVADTLATGRGRRQLRIINVSSSLLIALTTSGLRPDIKTCGSIADACEQLGLVKKALSTPTSWFRSSIRW